MAVASISVFAKNYVGKLRLDHLVTCLEKLLFVINVQLYVSQERAGSLPHNSRAMVLVAIVELNAIAALCSAPSSGHLKKPLPANIHVKLAPFHVVAHRYKAPLACELQRWLHTDSDRPLIGAVRRCHSRDRTSPIYHTQFGTKLTLSPDCIALQGA